jgi:hypothetical protein
VCDTYIVQYNSTGLLNPEDEHFEDGPFEASGTASHPTRTEPSATPLTEPEITQQ